MSERRVGRQRLYRAHMDRLKPIYDWVVLLERYWTESYERLMRRWRRAFTHRRNDMAASKNPTRVTVEPGHLDLFITREFDAPRDVVLKAFTDPEIYVQWVGPRDLTTTMDMFSSRSAAGAGLHPKGQAGQRLPGFTASTTKCLPPSASSAPSRSKACRRAGRMPPRNEPLRGTPGGRTRVTTQSGLSICG